MRVIFPDVAAPLILGNGLQERYGLWALGAHVGNDKDHSPTTPGKPTKT